MLTTLRNLGILAWIGCLLTLAFQASTWALTACWPSLSLLGLTYNFFGWDLTSSINVLPFEYVVKAIYVLAVTDLALALWWLGVVFYTSAMLWRIFTK